LARILKRLAIAGLASGLAFGAGQRAGAAEPAPFELVTAAEAQREWRAAPAEAGGARPPRLRSLKSTAPQIEVLVPQGDGGTVTAPLRIELAFRPAPGTRVVPASFRALYGVLKIDLTERLIRHAVISEAGVVVDRALVPDGNHRFLLRVNDDQGNLGEQELRVRVGSR
jgi:hypothetical protein